MICSVNTMRGSGEFSWWDYRMGAFRRNIGFRIDHIYATRNEADACTRSWIDSGPRKRKRPSDHAPVLAELQLD
jgi:exodeoxyribonuclease-3